MTDVGENGLNKAKTPISYLQEICMKKGVTPQYDLVANEGAVHEPLFVFKVIAGDVVGTGKGPSKKKAKHNAAISALNQMVDCNNLFPVLPSSSSESPLNSSSLMDSGDNFSSNPVGELQEMTQKRMWPPPVYHHINEIGPPHDRDFVCTVQLFDHEEQAIGKSKKLAKRNAAILMLQKIKQGSIVPSDRSPKTDNADSLIKTQSKVGPIDKENCQMGLTNSSFINKEPVEKKRSSMFLKSKNAKQGKLLEVLQNMDFNTPEHSKDESEHVKLLQELAKEQNFHVNFHMTISRKGLHMCTAEMTTVPPCVMPGTGTSPDLAKEDSAKNALRILKILTK